MIHGMDNHSVSNCRRYFRFFHPWGFLPQRLSFQIILIFNGGTGIVGILTAVLEIFGGRFDMFQCAELNDTL